MSRRSRGSRLTVRDLTTTPDYPGREIEKPLGIVTSLLLETDRFLSASQLKEVISPAVSDCYKQILRQADELDADAVVAVRFDYKQIGFNPELENTATLIMAYGTAVRLKWR